jgi:N-acetylmuramate 1-kinase
MPDQDVRLQHLKVWLEEQLATLFAEQGWGAVPPATLTAASSDASFRRYFRWEGEGRSFVVMDAPPPQENCKPFVDIAFLLAKSGINVPKIYAQDLERGFLLLNDLGNKTYLDVIDSENADDLFRDALQALLAFQQLPMVAPLPSYDVALLRRELELFPDWYVKHELGVEFDSTQQALWQRTSDLLIESALAQPKVLVHRDYMPRNLMLSEPNPGVLDFQDAVYGPVTYHLPVQGRVPQLARGARTRLAGGLLAAGRCAGHCRATGPRKLPARQRPDGGAASPESHRHLRPHLSPRRQAALLG